MSTPLGSSQWMYSSGEEVTQQSLKFNDDESQYLSWTPAAAGDQKTWTWSAWVKRGNLGTNQTIFCGGTGSTLSVEISFRTDNKLHFLDTNNSWLFITSQVFRDVSSWYHIVIECDTTQATVNDRTKLYVNGEQVTSFSTDNRSNFSQNEDTAINSANAHYFGRWINGGSYFDGYLSDINFIDGQALDPTSFGQFTNGYWEKKDYAGTYGTNGFHLTFQDDVVSEGFNAVTWRATGANQSISGLGFEPDLVWSKRRDASQSHSLFDTVRGAQLVLYSDYTGGDDSLSSSLLSFDSDGFTVGSGNGAINNSGGSYVSWAWDAGSGSPVSNTDGSITSTVKANPDYGFSIVSWTGTGSSSTVGHGLNSTPELIINKNRSAAENWVVYSTAQTDGSKYLRLNGSSALISDSSVFGAAPTASLFTVGTNPEGNGNGNNHIAYCFHSVAGYSSIGSYTGNGSTSGPTVTTGFRPAFVLFKNADDTDDWVILDNTRNPSNPLNSPLFPSGNYAEETNANRQIEISDTGFQVTSSGQWINGNGEKIIYMAFADTREAAFWKDVSGQGNHWTPNNLDYRDSLIDSPANNFCTGNPLKSYTSGSAMVYAEGNLKLDRPGTGTGWASSFGTMSVSSGKWYWEAQCFDSGSADEFIGIHEANTSMFQILGYSGDPTGYSYNASSGNKYNNNTGTSYGASYADGDVIGVALDMDAGTVTFYKNGASQGTAFTGLSGDFMPAFSSDYSTGYGYWIANFGQDSTFSGNTTAGGNQDDNGIGDFKYAPPAGYLALCTSNLPTPSIVDGSEYFNTVLYTGNASTNAITGVGFDLSTDGGLVWIKNRPSAYYHGLYDSVRGTGITKSLSSNRTEQEGFLSTNHNLVSFDSDGFTLGSTSNTNTLNTSGQSHVAWNWKAGGTAVSNTDGSITSSVSANTDAGFSIVSYTGTGSNATVGHGLGVEPSMIIVKNRIDARNWSVWHKDLSSNDYYLRLDSTDAQASAGANYWNSTAPTSSVFSVGVEGDVNDSGDGMIAYCFANSDTTKVGSYTGNGSSDGPFVYTGFRPAWVMWKRTDSADSWYMYDFARNPFNVVNAQLYANSSGAEYVSGDRCDLLSNGFKLKTTNGGENASGGTYIYLAFAETPFKYANAR